MLSINPAKHLQTHSHDLHPADFVPQTLSNDAQLHINDVLKTAPPSALHINIMLIQSAGSMSSSAVAVYKAFTGLGDQAVHCDGQGHHITADNGAIN